VEEEHEEAVKLLLNNGAYIDLLDSSSYSALTRAQTKKLFSMVDLLKFWGACEDPFMKNQLRKEKLLRCAACGYTKQLKEVLERPIDVNCRDEGQNTPLILAARYGHRKAVELLLQHEKVDVWAYNRFRCTALYEAQLYESKSAVIHLLRERVLIENLKQNKFQIP
jgi:ankyrin repeat protein